VALVVSLPGLLLPDLKYLNGWEFPHNCEAFFGS